jgi:hypothetical protein
MLWIQELQISWIMMVVVFENNYLIHKKKSRIYDTPTDPNIFKFHAGNKWRYLYAWFKISYFERFMRDSSLRFTICKVQIVIFFFANLLSKQSFLSPCRSTCKFPKKLTVHSFLSSLMSFWNEFARIRKDPVWNLESSSFIVISYKKNIFQTIYHNSQFAVC